MQCNNGYHIHISDKIHHKERDYMPEPNARQSIEYQKQMIENVYITLPGPAEPFPGMTGGELLHGFLAELYRAPTEEMKAYVANLCNRWNVHYRKE
jgi:hypothetical protein